MLAQRVYYQGSYYFEAASVARELRGIEQWDPGTRIWRLTAGTHDIRLAPQMEVAMVDGISYPLSSPAIVDSRGRLLVPERFYNDRLARWQPPPSMIQRPAAAGRLRVITVDAGHGGHDPGAFGRTGLKEKTITLDIARRLADLLRKDGFQVVMTRNDDRFIPLPGRSSIANRAGADLFISVHANASRSRSADGFEAYYLSEATDDHARAIEAAENATLPEEWGEAVPSQSQAILWDLLYTENRVESSELASHICRGMTGNKMASKCRGIKTARFAVLKGARMPSVLVEVGFITHPKEESYLRSPEYRQRIAEGIRRGVVAFRDEMDRRYAYAR